MTSCGKVRAALDRALADDAWQRGNYSRHTHNCQHFVTELVREALGPVPLGKLSLVMGLSVVLTAPVRAGELLLEAWAASQ